MPQEHLQEAEPHAAANGQPEFLGWRHLPRTLPDGTVLLDRVPLTLEDILHPQEGDQAVEPRRHRQECTYLESVLSLRYADDPQIEVLSDVGVDWGIEGLKLLAPDLALFRDVLVPYDPNEAIFHLVASGGRIVLVVEIVSPSTRRTDVVDKLREYYLAGVPLYVIVDQEKKHGPRRILGYRWTAAGYELQPLDAQGRLLLEPGGLLLGLQDERITLYDPDTGEALGDYAQIIHKLEAAQQARRQAERAHKRAQQRSQHLEAQQQQEAAARQQAEARQQQEAEARQQAEKARRRADKARRQAEERQQQEAAARQQAEERQQQEAAARQQAEERVRALEDELRRLRQQS
jgi:Uma2 family endonuclease